MKFENNDLLVFERDSDKTVYVDFVRAISMAVATRTQEQIECDKFIINLDDEENIESISSNVCAGSFKLLEVRRQDKVVPYRTIYTNNTDIKTESVERVSVLSELKRMLDNNTLYRVFPYDTAKNFEIYLKSNKIVKDWLEND